MGEGKVGGKVEVEGEKEGEGRWGRGKRWEGRGAVGMGRRRR